MATRLYPIVSNESALEILAGVPQGTLARLREIQARYADRHTAAPQDGYEMLDAYLAEVALSPDIARLESFESDGWGRISRRFVETVERYGLESGYGEAKDSVLVTNLLCAKGIDPEVVMAHIVGLSWG